MPAYKRPNCMLCGNWLGYSNIDCARCKAVSDACKKSRLPNTPFDELPLTWQRCSEEPTNTAGVNPTTTEGAETMHLYNVVVWLNDEENPKILVPMKQIIAKNANQVRVLAHREIPEEHLDDLDKVVVAVHLIESTI